MMLRADPASPDRALLALCAEYMAAHLAAAALWPPGDVNPSAGTEAALDRASRRLARLHEAICRHRPATRLGRLALARVALCHVAKDEAGEPLSDRDRPLVALARAVLAEAAA